MFTPPADLFIGGWQIHLYSIFFAAALLAGYLTARQYALRQGFPEQQFDTTVLVLFLFGLIGARLFFAVGHWDYFAEHLAEIPQFWKGGLAFYGGVLGGALGLLLVRIFSYKLPLFKFLDAAALGLALGQAIGRLGNYFNQEAYGSPTDLPWGIYISPEKRLPELASAEYFHPTFAYEALGLAVIFFILRAATRRHPPAGTIFAIYVILAGVLRFSIELLRVDALRVNDLKISSLTAIVLVVIGAITLIKQHGKQVN